MRLGKSESGGTLQNQNGPVNVNDYYSAIYVCEADTWKIRMEYTAAFKRNRFNKTYNKGL
jgi:hypothetical protein